MIVEKWPNPRFNDLDAATKLTNTEAFRAKKATCPCHRLLRRCQLLLAVENDASRPQVEKLAGPVHFAAAARLPVPHSLKHQLLQILESFCIFNLSLMSFT